MKKIAIILFFFFIGICFSSCHKTYRTPQGAKTYQKPMDAIYIYQSGFGEKFAEYKIDLKGKQFWIFTLEGEYDHTARDTSADNEGFTFAGDIDEDKIETFILDSSRYGFTAWKVSYDNPTVSDGLQWGITIGFSDGTHMQVFGSNAFPETWKKMCSAFTALTGTDILPFDAPDQYI